MAAKSLLPTNTYAVPGVLNIIFFPFYQTDGTAALNIARTAGVITTLAVESAPFIVKIEAGTGSAPEVLNKPTPGVVNIKQSVGGKFARISDDTQATMQALNLGRFGAVVEVEQGQYWLVGESHGLTMEKNDGGWSTEAAGYDFLLSGLQTVHAGRVSSSLWDTLFADAADAAVAS